MLDHRCHRHSFKSPAFDLSLPCRVFLFILFLQSHFHSMTVRAEANITVDDGDSRIIYSPPGAWTKSAQTQLDYGGSHMLSQNPNATAIFNFIGESGGKRFVLAVCCAFLSIVGLGDYDVLTNTSGTAFYFISPLWPYNVNTAISLDSSPSSLIDLVDHSKPNENQGAESVPFSVVWSAVNLPNTQHVVRISVGSGETYAIIDALMFVSSPTSSTDSTLNFS